MKHLLPRLLGALVLMGAGLGGWAQTGVGIGTAAPDASAALDVRASGQGLLVPRLSEAQRQGIARPATGLLVYQTDGPQPGFWFNAGTAAAPGWTFINPSPDNLGNHTATQALNLQANALTGTGASIGTTVGLGVRADGGLNLGQNTPGNNVIVGFQAGAATTGTQNQFMGYRSGAATTTGSRNQFAGYQSGLANTTGGSNVFVGFNSGPSNTTGSQNVFMGTGAGFFTTTGRQNVFVGGSCGALNTGGSNNWGFGHNAGPIDFNLTNAGGIGYEAQVSRSNSLVLGGTGANAVNVGIGTTAPENTFDVQREARTGTHATDRAFYATASVGEASNGFEFRHSNGTQGIGIGYNSLYATGSSNSQNLNLMPKGGGNVGIGTTSPAYRLDVNGSGRFSGRVFQEVEVFSFPGGVAGSTTFTVTWTHNLGFLPVLLLSVDQTNGQDGDYIIVSYDNVNVNQTIIRARNLNTNVFRSAIVTVTAVVVGSR